MTAQIEPFRIETPQAGLDDPNPVAGRLPGLGWSRGVPLDYLRDSAVRWWASTGESRRRC